MIIVVWNKAAKPFPAVSENIIKGFFHKTTNSCRVTTLAEKRYTFLVVTSLEFLPSVTSPLSTILTFIFFAIKIYNVCAKTYLYLKYCFENEYLTYFVDLRIKDNAWQQGRDTIGEGPTGWYPTLFCYIGNIF